MVNAIIAGLTGFSLILALAVGAYFLYMFITAQSEAKKREDAARAAAAAAATAPSGRDSGYGASGAKADKVVTKISAQSDDETVVKLNDDTIGTINGYSTITEIETRTAIGDTLSFHVHNGGAFGGLRALVVRGRKGNEQIYKTGDDGVFTLLGKSWDLASNLYKESEMAHTIAATKDAGIKFLETEWIWDESKCQNCDVVFVLKIK